MENFNLKKYLAEGKLKEELRYGAPGIRVGTEYDVEDVGSGEFRENMEYLGYYKNENAHMFRKFINDYNDIDIMYVKKGDLHRIR